MKTISDIVYDHGDTTLPDPDGLVAALVAREDEVADVMRLAAIQFGLYPQIVAKVFADIKFGSPISEEQNALIQAQFQALMVAFQEAFNNGTPPPAP